MAPYIVTTSIDMTLGGENCEFNITYDSTRKGEYKDSIHSMLREIREKRKPISSHQWNQLLSRIEHSLLQRHYFWLHHVFYPLKERIAIPPLEAVCACSHNPECCRLQLLHYTHYEEGGSLWQVSLDYGEVRVSYNCARNDSEDVEQLITFYETCINQYYRFDVDCCPIGKMTLQSIEEFVSYTENIFKDLRKPPLCPML